MRRPRGPLRARSASRVAPRLGFPNSQVVGPLGLRDCGLPQRPCSRVPLRRRAQQRLARDGHTRRAAEKTLAVSPSSDVRDALSSMLGARAG
jgi:hypothetical protein